jgi:8-oxo-dGTP diphosphatase
MECKSYTFDTLSNYKYADVIAIYKGQWVFCKHKDRATWESPGGHIDNGETPLEAAKRELFEETGAIDFNLKPLCDYWTNVKYNGEEVEGNGQVYLANILALTDIPNNSEIEKICLYDSFPDNLTYPEYVKEIFPLAIEMMKKNNCKKITNGVWANGI